MVFQRLFTKLKVFGFVLLLLLCSVFLISHHLGFEFFGGEGQPKEAIAISHPLTGSSGAPNIREAPKDSNTKDSPWTFEDEVVEEVDKELAVQELSPEEIQDSEWLLSLVKLSVIDIAPRFVGSDYNREKDWGSGWAFLDDKECIDIREEVLILEAVSYRLDEQKCSIESGLWIDIYTGEEINNMKDIHIDHTVSVNEAHLSGGHNWPSSKKKQYYNFLQDGNHLNAIAAKTNLEKSNQSIDSWLPPEEESVCAYIAVTVEIKFEWGLSMTSGEHSLAEAILENCAREDGF